jgi:hypothetical protein
MDIRRFCREHFRNNELALLVSSIGRARFALAGEQWLAVAVRSQAVTATGGKNEKAWFIRWLVASGL